MRLKLHRHFWFKGNFDAIVGGLHVLRRFYGLTYVQWPLSRGSPLTAVANRDVVNYVRLLAGETKSERATTACLRKTAEAVIAI